MTRTPSYHSIVRPQIEHQKITAVATHRDRGALPVAGAALVVAFAHHDGTAAFRMFQYRSAEDSDLPQPPAAAHESQT